jgi:hypothetical protein
MSYYECKRCNTFKTKYKQNMITHIDRTRKCPKTAVAYNYTDEELYNSSLKLIECKSDDSYDKEELLCEYCKKYFSRKDNLIKHQKRYHQEEINNENINTNVNTNTENNTNTNAENNTNTNVNSNDNVVNSNENVINSNNTTNNNSNNTVNNININNNIVLQPFDDNWNIDHINKYIIFLSLKKYTTFLDKILEKYENLNVIIDGDSDSGLVYKNEKEKYVNMKKKEIFSMTMEKINKQMCELFDDVIENENTFGTDVKDFLNKQKKNANYKYEDYVKKDNIKQEANSYIEDIFKKKKDEAKDILMKNNKNEGY